MKYISLLTLTFLLGYANTFGQSPEDLIRYTQRLPVGSARTSAMAGVGRAGIGDPSAMNTNPAGLGWMQNSAFVIGGNSLKMTDESNFLPSNSGGSTIVNHSGLSDFDYVKKLNVAQGSLAFGVGWHQTANFNRETNFEGTNSKSYMTDYLLPAKGAYNVGVGADGIIGTKDDIFEFDSIISQIAFEAYAIDFDKNLYAANKYPFFGGMNRGNAKQSGSMKEAGTMREFTMGGAWEATKNVMIGLSVGLNSGALAYNRDFTELDVDNANDGKAKYVDTQTGEQLTVDFASLTLKERLDASISGAVARVGVSTKLTENLKLGFYAESPTAFAIEEDYNTILETVYDNGDNYAYGGQGNDAGTDVVNYQMTTPWKLGGGAEFKIAGARLFGDVEYSDWSRMEVTADFDTEYYRALTKLLSQQYQPTMNLSVGGEYTLGPLTVRGGWASQPDARKEPLDGKRDKQYMTAGAGLKLGKKYQLHVGFMRESYDDTYRPYSDLSTSSPSVFTDDSVVKRNITRDMVKFGLGIKL